MSSISVASVLCMYVCVCVYMCMYTHIHMCMSGGPRSIFDVIPQVLKL